MKTCFNCGSNNLIVESNTEFCGDCGYHTTSFYTNLSDNFRENPISEFDLYLYRFPKLIGDLVLRQTDNTCWLPIILHSENIATLMVDGTSKDCYKWCVFTYENIPLLDRLMNPIEGKKDSYYEMKMIPHHFDSFKDAFEYYKSLINSGK